MPTISYTCQCCRLGFPRIILRGETAPLAECPRCRSSDTRVDPGPASLFEGIAGFSSLAADTD